MRGRHIAEGFPLVQARCHYHEQIKKEWDAILQGDGPGAVYLGTLERTMERATESQSKVENDVSIL